MTTSPPTTLLHHSEEIEKLVEGFEAIGSYKKVIEYNNGVTWRQAFSVVTRSESCHYHYTEKCKHSIMSGYTFWEAFNGQLVHDLTAATDTLCRGRWYSLNVSSLYLVLGSFIPIKPNTRISTDIFDL